jgi:hypothetical protein
MIRTRLMVCVAPACITGAVTLALSGCAGSSAVSSVVDPVAQAADVSELAPGFKVSLSEEIFAPGVSEPVTGSGTEIVDQRDQRGVLSLRVSAEGHTATTESQYSDFALFMRLPGSHESSIAHGKPWVEFDLRRAGAALGVNVSSLSGSTSSNPGQMLSYLKAASGQVTRVGTEQVRGVQATHYRATVEYERYASKVPVAKRAAARASVAAIERLTGSDSQVVDVWVDAQHRVRREELTLHECLPGISRTTQIHLKMEFFDFAVQAIPSPPPSSEVANITSYVAEKLKHVKLGCQ